MKRRLPLVLLSLLAGCAHYEAKPLDADGLAARFEARTLADPDFRRFVEQNQPEWARNWPPRAWGLPELTLAAFYFQPSLQVSRTEWQVARAGTRTAAGRPNPSVSVGTGYDSQVAGNFSPWMPSLSFDLPLETAGKRQRRIEQADALSESARLSIATAAWAVRAEVRASLVELTAAQERERLVQSEVALQEEINQRLQAQFAAGSIAVADTISQRTAAARAAVDLGDARRQLAQARVRLAQAVGLPAAALQDVSLHFDLSGEPPASQLNVAAARTAALHSRADILGGLSDYAAAQAALRLEIAKQYPDLHLGPGYSWNQGNEGDSEWQLGLTLELPLLNRNQGPIAEATARRANAAARFAALQAKAIGEIDQALAGVEAGRANLAALRQVIAATQSQRESTDAQVKAGATDRLALLGNDLALNAAALGRLEAEFALQQAVGALESAVQQPVDLVLPASTISLNPP